MIKKMPEKKKGEEVKVEGEIRFLPGTPAEVKELLNRSESRGDITQIVCLILDGRDKNKTIRRNVRGPIKTGDILMLMETEIEAQRLGGGRKGGKKKGGKEAKKR